MKATQHFFNSSRRACMALTLSAMVVWGTGCSSDGSGGENSNSSHFISDLEPGRPITAHTVGREPVAVNQPRAGSADQANRVPASPDSGRESRLRPVDLPGAGSGSPAVGGGGAGGNPAGRSPSGSSFEDDEAAILAQMNDELNSPRTSSSAAYQGEDVWAILLRSVATDTHQQDAAEVQRIFAQACPQLRGMWIHSGETGSMVLYGRFASVDDPAAQEALKWVKSQRATNGAQPFHAVMLVRVESADGGRGNVHPFDLRTLRRAHPRINPLYSLQVAAWVGPDDNASAWQECKRQAEQYAASLRGQGHEAWFFHDDTARISSVTVGKFDKRIINQTSGLYTAELGRMYDQFPRHLLNGEEVLVRENVNDPSSRLVPQQPRLVEVPKDLE